MTTLKIKVANEIFLASSSVDLSLEQFIKHELVFPNPKRLELMRLGYSVWKVPKVISCYRKLKSGYYLPIGFGPKLWLGDVFLVIAHTLELGHHLALRCYGCVVCTGHPAGVLAVHTSLADEHVVQGVVEYVAHMKDSGHVWRRNYNGVRFFLVRF